MEERQRLAPTRVVPPSQVDRLACILQGFALPSFQERDFAELREPVDLTDQRACAEIPPKCLLQQCATLSWASHERIRMTADFEAQTSGAQPSGRAS
jgi:hypothetical protein